MSSLNLLPKVTRAARNCGVEPGYDGQRRKRFQAGELSSNAGRGNSTGRLTIATAEQIFNYMVELDSQLDSVFHALGDGTRRRMLRQLAEGERTVGQLAEPYAMSLAAASKHIKALEHAGLISREVRGRTHVCRLEAGPLASADQWLRLYERFWTERLDVLDRLLRHEDEKSSTSKGEKR
jgi:DNA-binding transcriptional ArsR family regulator